MLKKFLSSLLFAWLILFAQVVSAAEVDAVKNLFLPGFRHIPISRHPREPGCPSAG